jgi:hypothetical protein
VLRTGQLVCIAWTCAKVQNLCLVERERQQLFSVACLLGSFVRAAATRSGLTQNVSALLHWLLRDLLGHVLCLHAVTFGACIFDGATRGM